MCERNGFVQTTELNVVANFRVTRARVRLSLRAISPAKPYPVQDRLRKFPLAPKNQKPYSKSRVPPLRESYALGTDSVGAQPHGLGRTQRSQQAPQTPTNFDVWGTARSVRPSVSLYGPSGSVYRPPYQRGNGRQCERQVSSRCEIKARSSSPFIAPVLRIADGLLGSLSP